MMRSTPKSYGFFLLPRFAMMAFTSAIEPLRAANLRSGETLYDWRIITRDGRPVASSNGVELVAQAAIGKAGKLDNLVICSGLDAHLFDDRKVFAWLREAAHRGARLGALSDGSFILAKAWGSWTATAVRSTGTASTPSPRPFPRSRPAPSSTASTASASPALAAPRPST